MVAGIFGADTTDVQREAIAAYGANSSARPVCPIAVGLCEFQQYQTSQNCSDLPQLNQVPSGNDTSGWTSLGPASASASEAVRYLPVACGGGGLPPPSISIGDTINIMNGMATSVLTTIDNCFKAGLLTECVIPIINNPCNTAFNQAKPIVGFATLKITSVTTNGMAANTGVQMKGICMTDEPGVPGNGPNLGTFSMALVD
jgi:hypothetical protein